MDMRVVYNVPVPEKKDRSPLAGKQEHINLSEMGVGGSFFVPEDPLRVHRRILQRQARGQYKNKRFSVHKETYKNRMGCRVWRTV